MKKLAIALFALLPLSVFAGGYGYSNGEVLNLGGYLGTGAQSYSGVAGGVADYGPGLSISGAYSTNHSWGETVIGLDLCGECGPAAYGASASNSTSFGIGGTMLAPGAHGSAGYEAGGTSFGTSEFGGDYSSWDKEWGHGYGGY